MDFDHFSGLLVSPLSWRTGVRRLFLLTLPISVPLWLGLMLFVGVLGLLHLIFRPIAIFWSAPPRPSERNYYGYELDPKLSRLNRSSKANIVDIDDKKAA